MDDATILKITIIATSLSIAGTNNEDRRAGKRILKLLETRHRDVLYVSAKTKWSDVLPEEKS